MISFKISWTTSKNLKSKTLKLTANAATIVNITEICKKQKSITFYLKQINSLLHTSFIHKTMKKYWHVKGFYCSIKVYCQFSFVYI